VVLLLAVALVSAQSDTPFPNLQTISFADCSVGLQKNLSATENMIAGKISFPGWASRTSLPVGCTWQFTTESWTSNQQLAFRLIHLQLPQQVVGSTFNYRLNVQTSHVPAGGDVAILAQSDTANPFNTLAWSQGNQKQWVSSNAATPTPTPNPATGTPPFTKGFTVTLTYVGPTPTSTVPLAEVNAPSTAYFALEWTLTEDKCPGNDNMWTPSNGAPYPLLTRCPQFNVANKSCCRTEDDTALTDWSGNPGTSTQTQFQSPGVIAWRDSACARHYGLAKCGVNCHPKSGDWWIRNTTSFRNELVICRSYCRTVLSACADERVWNQYNLNNNLVARSPKISEVYSPTDDIAFCNAYFSGLISGPYSTLNGQLRIDDNGGKCFDAGLAAAGATFTVSALTLVLVLVALFI